MKVVGPNIDRLLIDNPDELNFIFDPGEYQLTKKLLINRQHVTFTGSTTADKIHIFQTNDTQDGLDVEANYFTMRNISLHVTTSNKVALSVANVNNCNINNCYIYGNQSTYTVFFAGPNVSTGSETLNAYYSDQMDCNNSFTDNVVYSKWSGDAVVFALQTNGQFRRNIIRGGKLAIYMCKYVTVQNNTIYDSMSSGIYLSFPCFKVNIHGNKIYECKENGIVLRNQLEHGSFSSSNYNIKIFNNYVSDNNDTGIDINDGNGITVNQNIISGSRIQAINLLRCSNIAVDSNKFPYFDIGIELNNSTDCKITNNSFYSIYPYDAHYFISLSNSSNNSVTGNTIYGHIINNQVVSNGNTIENNIFQPYYTKEDEKKLIKFCSI